MKDVPWISEGRKARIFGAAAGSLRGTTCAVLSVEPPRGGGFPDVHVEADGEKKTLRPWQVVDTGFKSSHRCSRIDDGVWFFEWQGYENNGNTVVLGGDRKVVVDAGHLHLLGSLLVALEEQGLSLDGMDAALFTHSHPDHFDSAGLIHAAGIPIGLSHRESHYLQGDGGALYGFFGASVPEVKIEIDLEPGDLAVAGLDMTVLHAPGHSPGSVCLYWKEKKVLCAGDVVFPGGAFGRCDFPGGSYRTLLDSFGVFDGLDIEVLLSGHGPAVVGRKDVEESIGASRSNLRAVVFSPW
jgi:hydroxyacylglutathione hydrolase